MGIATLLGACQNENEPKRSSALGTEGDYRIIIEGDEIDSPSRSGEARFVGGTASGAGLYDGDGRTDVTATPNSDYEIDYFWGGPASDPDKYTTSSTAATTYDVRIGGEDHTFHLKFKEKKRDVIIDAGAGGSVSPSGRQTWKVEQGHQITATPNSGYEFTGWSVSGSGITLDNSSSATTNVTLASDYSSNGTITAKFARKVEQYVVQVEYYYDPDGDHQGYMQFYPSGDVGLCYPNDGYRDFTPGWYDSGVSFTLAVSNEVLNSGGSNPTDQTLFFTHSEVNGQWNVAQFSFTLKRNTTIKIYYSTMP